ncbi:MAG: phosphatase PAP2 family protein [Chloroflexi bacterium]|nr:phosphatase PAP2 family protein [Chloroflexota bacterium]
MDIDASTVRWLNDAATRWSILHDAATWAAKDLQFGLVATLVVGGLAGAYPHLRRRELPFRFVEGVLVALLALGIGMAANKLAGGAWFRARPYDAVSGVQLLVAPSPDPSFPSDHATAAFCLAVGIGIALPWLRNLLLVQTGLLLLGRVAVGLHYPSDIAGGLFIALGAVALAQGVMYVVRRALYEAVAPQVRTIVRLGPPSPVRGSQGPVLIATGLFAAIVGLPMALEVAADPVRLHPEWVEVGVLTASWAALAALCVLALKLGGWSRPHSVRP